MLVKASFDDFAERQCALFYASRQGRPSLPPGRYFRMHLVGYFEGIDSERGLEWRCTDSLSLREFLRLGTTEPVPDHSWLSRTRSRLPLAVQRFGSSRLLGIAAGDMTAYGLPKPDHKLFEAHPTVSSELLPRLGHGDIAVKPNIDRYSGGRTVRFADGSEEEIDLVIYCTGYKMTFPFFDPEVFSAPDNRLPLYKRMLKPVIDYLVFVGFAQAFLLCGSRSVCLSLWPVDDAATALLMERFYQNLLGKRQGLTASLRKAAALAEAKAWLRQLSAEEALAKAAGLRQGVARAKHDKPGADRSMQPREAKPYAHPYYWAAFVLIGDPD